MSHDFGIPALGVGTEASSRAGPRESFVFKVPDHAAAATYICTPHSAMMSGRIVVAK